MPTIRFLCLTLLCCSCVRAPRADTVPTTDSTVLVVSDAPWEDLNPARGDKSPKAATLWGDRHGAGATGFLFHAKDGFQSPPHLHNVSYRGVVIGGLIHNADPEAEKTWMPAGSFWTQPKGGVHITAAKGSDVLAYIEIDEGPYLVLPVDRAFDAGADAVNLLPSDITWVDAREFSNTGSSLPDGVELASLWGDPRGGAPSGVLLRLPAGFIGTIEGGGPSLRAVVIQGRIEHRAPTGDAATTMDPGSYFSSRETSVHRVSCRGQEECIVYVRADGELRVASS